MSAARHGFRGASQIEILAGSTRWFHLWEYLYMCGFVCATTCHNKCFARVCLRSRLMVPRLLLDATDCEVSLGPACVPNRE